MYKHVPTINPLCRISIRYISVKNQVIPDSVIPPSFYKILTVALRQLNTTRDKFWTFNFCASKQALMVNAG